MKNTDKKPIAVYITTTKTIGVIIDKGTDSAGHWYRTDADGVREPSELLFCFTKKDVKNALKQLGGTIAPSTKKLIGI